MKLVWLGQYRFTTSSIQGLHRGDFSLPSNSLRSCTLLWWIFCTITDYCYGNRCITWQLCYLRDKKQLLKETGIHQEWGYLFLFFFFFHWPHIVLKGLADFLMDAAPLTLIVKNISVHQLKVIFSQIIFSPLAAYVWKKKKTEKKSSCNLGEKQSGFFSPSSAALSSAAVLLLLS